LIIWANAMTRQLIELESWSDPQKLGKSSSFD